MKYKLTTSGPGQKISIIESLKKFIPLLKAEGNKLLITLIALLINAGANLFGPLLIGYTIDYYFISKDFQGVLFNAGILGVMYIAGSIAIYIQTKTMGGVGRRLLFTIRNRLFHKLQELPIAFFNQNKSGDLISRINNDTDKLNTFIAQSLMQFIGSFFLMTGTVIFILFLNFELGIVSLLPALGVLIVSIVISPWIKQKNLASLQSTGSVSSEIQESLSNFKVVIAFNRLDYFVEKFRKFNDANYTASVGAGIASNVFVPIYGLAANLASLASLCFGLYLVHQGSLTIGFLISFQLYVTTFYTPLRQLASVWALFQLALASLDRVSEIMDMSSDLEVIPSSTQAKSESILEFQNVSFHYPEGENILKNINFSLQKAKTYALIGPTGGGKTTTASIMARLYDPTQGVVLLDGRDIRSYEPNERTKKIGFILQEPFLFSGTLIENIVYANEVYEKTTKEDFLQILQKSDLSQLLDTFESGLDTKIVPSAESMSLGQKQIIAFVRAFLRSPELLILDEATANIDTVTEQLLEEILLKLPASTTKVIIAHRLNTIKDADEIFFVNGGSITVTGSMEKALEMMLDGKRES